MQSLTKQAHCISFILCREIHMVLLAAHCLWLYLWTSHLLSRWFRTGNYFTPEIFPIKMKPQSGGFLPSELLFIGKDLVHNITVIIFWNYSWRSFILSWCSFKVLLHDTCSATTAVLWTSLSYCTNPKDETEKQLKYRHSKEVQLFLIK